MVGFAKEKKEFEVAYQQQVNDIFFYDYCCYMKKHDITDDIPSIPSDEENEANLGEEAEQGDDLTMGDKSVVTGHDDQDTA